MNTDYEYMPYCVIVTYNIDIFETKRTRVKITHSDNQINVYEKIMHLLWMQLNKEQK